MILSTEQINQSYKRYLTNKRDENNPNYLNDSRSQRFQSDQSGKVIRVINVHRLNNVTIRYHSVSEGVELGIVIGEIMTGC